MYTHSHLHFIFWHNVSTFFLFVLHHLGQFYVTACVKLSVESDINVLDEYGRTCLHAAASGG